MTPVGSWNLTITDTAGQPILPIDMRVQAEEDGAPKDINGLPQFFPCTIAWDGINPGRARLDFWATAGSALNVTIWAKAVGKSYKLSFRCDQPTGVREAVGPPTHPCIDPTPLPGMVETEPSAFPFPPKVVQTALPPFDAPDGPPDNNQVATTPPPDLVVPTVRDVMFMRADFNGVTLPGDYEPKGTDAIIANGGVTMTTGRWAGLFVPFLVGANTTPPTMIMTPMLTLYWALGHQAFVTAVLTEHAERGYTHMIWDPHPWNLEENGMTFSIDQMIAWAQLLKAAGFFNVIWSGEPSVADPMWHALTGNGLIDFAIIGEEVDSKFTAEDYCAIVTSLLNGALLGVPAAMHTTSNYPIHAERDTFFAGGASGSWADFDGRFHMCWQADQNDTAGRRAALLYYARLRVNLGGIGGDGRQAPNCRVYDFENQASGELFGKENEVKGCLQGLEDMYAPVKDAGVRPMSGFGDGCRNPDGSYFHL